MIILLTLKKLLARWLGINIRIERAYLHIQSALQIIDECDLNDEESLSDIHTALSKALAELNELVNH